MATQLRDHLKLLQQ